MFSLLQTFFRRAEYINCSFAIKRKLLNDVHPIIYYMPTESVSESVSESEEKFVDPNPNKNHSDPLHCKIVDIFLFISTVIAKLNLTLAMNSKYLAATILYQNLRRMFTARFTVSLNPDLD
jgi:hypothetical protein